MTDLIIKYFFQNEKDTTPNHIILNTKKQKLANIKDIISLMLTHDLIDANCYLRFKDFMDDQLCWVDIRNYMAPYPINRNNEVEIKILRVPYQLYDDSFITKVNERPKATQKSENRDKSKSTTDKINGGKRSHTANELPKKSEPIKQSVENRIGLDSVMFADDGYQKINEEPPQLKMNSGNNDFDFFTEQSIRIKVEKPRKDSFDILNVDHTTEVKQLDNDLYNLEFSNTHNQQIKNNTREEQIQMQADKMKSANYLEPMVKTWAYNNTVRKDIRTLLSTLDKVLWKDFNKWTFVSISDILSDVALKNKIREAKIKFHPDKNTELPADKQYLLERIISEINAAYKEYQKLNYEI